VLFSRLDFARGPLNAFELFNLEQPPGTVVLVSSDLGRFDFFPGDETLGFTASLLHAGAKTVIASIGRASDDLTRELMVDFHRHLTAGMNAAEALASAGERHVWHPFMVFGS
jgi:hypothetical protein